MRVLKIDRPLAEGFVSLTAFQAEGCGSGFAADKKKVKAGAAGCVEGLCDRHGATLQPGFRRFKGQVPAPPLDTPAA